MFEFLHKSNTVLGMNARNLEYIRPYNKARGKRLSDNKILCKKILKKNDLPTSKLLATIPTLADLDAFDWDSLPSSFALKPNKGFGGEGIVVVYGKKKNGHAAWIKADGSIVTIEDLKTHIRNIIDGSFSISNTPDIAFFEERLTLLKLFKPYAFKGIPDIRVIVFNTIPVMAMLRLPTKDSGGKANLHQGAIGLGIDLASGTTTTAIVGKGTLVEYAPGTRLPLSGIKIPYWKDILLMAVRAQEVSGLGFLGADIAIDRERGPVFLELNARPGLSIQNANLDGLKSRLERVKGLKVKNAARGVRIGRDLFGGEIEEELEEISGKKILGSVATIKLIGLNEKTTEIPAKIDTGADSTAIDTSLAKALGFEEALRQFDEKMSGRNVLGELTKKEREELFADIPLLTDTVPVKSSHGISYRPIITLDLVINDVVMRAKVSVIDRSHLAYPVIVGKSNLRKFLIDVNK